MSHSLSLMHSYRSFKDEGMFPNMVPMPMPDKRHMDCFIEWAENGGAEVCSALRDQPGYGGLRWEDLFVSCIECMFLCRSVCARLICFHFGLGTLSDVHF